MMGWFPKSYTIENDPDTNDSIYIFIKSARSATDDVTAFYFFSYSIEFLLPYFYINLSLY